MIIEKDNTGLKINNLVIVSVYIVEENKTTLNKSTIDHLYINLALRNPSAITVNEW